MGDSLIGGALVTSNYGAAVSSKHKRVTSGRPREHAPVPAALSLYAGAPITRPSLVIRHRPRRG